jgi:hypothetical protein
VVFSNVFGRCLPGYKKQSSPTLYLSKLQKSFLVDVGRIVGDRYIRNWVGPVELVEDLVELVSRAESPKLGTRRPVGVFSARHGDDRAGGRGQGVLGFSSPVNYLVSLSASEVGG